MASNLFTRKIPFISLGTSRCSMVLLWDLALGISMHNWYENHMVLSILKKIFNIVYIINEFARTRKNLQSVTSISIPMCFTGTGANCAD